MVRCNNQTSDVTLASADPSLLLCWEEKARQGLECSTLLKHRRGEVITILKFLQQQQDYSCSQNPFQAAAAAEEEKQMQQSESSP